MSNIPSRRAFLAASAAASIASAAPSLGRAADAHAFMLGALEIIVVSDGHLVVPAHGLATNADRKYLELILAASGQPGEWLEPATNVTLIRAGGDLILIDTGAGPHYMPTAGKLLANMAMAGLQPQSITKVIFTHAHPDHIWGTLDELDESPNFPNASYVIAAADNWDKHRLPTIQGVVVVVDARDGRPLAMMDSITLTGLRTAATAALAAGFGAKTESKSAAIIGCGTQAKYQLEALRAVFSLQIVRVFDIDHARAETFAAASATPTCAVTSVSSVRAAVEDADICVTCTTSKSPVLTDDLQLDGCFVAAVGADNPDKQEIASALMGRARILVDDLDASASGGDLKHALEPGIVRREQVHADLAELAAARKQGRLSSDELVIFDSTGSGVQDVAAAWAAYGEAARTGAGVRFDFTGEAIS